MEMLVECKQMRRHVLALAMGISVLSSSLAQVQSSTESLIHVEVAGLRSNKGEVLCSLFSSASDFPRRPQKGVAPAKGDISDHHAVCEFVGIPPGTYAVSLFHDENSNGKLDTNFMGIPREGVGASNNAKGHFGPPQFEAAAFRFPGGRLNLTIKINYF
jgi:uncharacterized protein (DUF2141 family)